MPIEEFVRTASFHDFALPQKMTNILSTYTRIPAIFPKVINGLGHVVEGNTIAHQAKDPVIHKHLGHTDSTRMEA